MNISNLSVSRLYRYPVLVAHIPKPKKGKKGELEAANQQKALASWLKCASKVILLNRPEDVSHLSDTKGVIFDERYSSGGSMPTPTVSDMLHAMVTECPSDGFGVIPVGNAVMEPDGYKTINSVRVSAQLSKAWACVDFGPVLYSVDDEDGAVNVGETVSAFWISRQVAKYIVDTGKNPPFANDVADWASWLGQELSAKVLGHRYFDATPRGLSHSLSVGGESPDYSVKRPFTKH